MQTASMNTSLRLFEIKSDDGLLFYAPFAIQNRLRNTIKIETDLAVSDASQIKSAR